jgi:hypothetical protein
MASPPPARRGGVARPDFSDDYYLRLGVQRVLESSESGSGFLQEHGVRFENAPELCNYFVNLRSARRCEVVRDANVALISAANQKLHDRLADIPELANYECLLVMATGTKARRMMPGTASPQP